MKPSSSSRPDFLADTLADTLERANAQLDPAVVGRLSRLRQQAVQASRSPLASDVTEPRWSVGKSSPPVQRFAMAAMVALCAVMLGVCHRLLPDRGETGLLAGSAPSVLIPVTRPLNESVTPPDAWAEDPQMLADWEMLYVLGDEPDAG